MVKQISKDKHRCEACNMLYATKDLAAKCEAWCYKHKSCNMEIIKHMIKES